MASPAIDYDALAKQFGGADVDYDALAKRFGGADLPAPRQPAPQVLMAPAGAPPMPAPPLPAELAPPKPTALDQPPQQFRPPAQPAQNIGPLPQVTGPTDYTPPGAQPAKQPGTPMGGPGAAAMPTPQLPTALQGPATEPSVAQRIGIEGPATGPPAPPPMGSRGADTRISPPITPDVDATLRDPQFKQVMASAWQGFADQVPSGQTPSEKVQNAIARTALGLMSPKSLATMLVAEGATQALNAAVNSTRGVAMLTRLGGDSQVLRQAVDIAAQNAVPAAFTATAGVQGTKAAIEYAKTGDPEKAVEAAANVVLGAAGGLGLRAGIKATGELYPPPPVEPTGTRAYQGAPAAPTPETQAQAPAMAEALEQQGRGLAAQSWRDIANHGRSGLPYEIDAGGRRLTIQPDPAKPTEFVKLVDPETGHTLTAGRPAAVRSWIDMNVVQTRTNPQGGGALSVGAGTAETAQVPQQAALGRPSAPINQIFDQQNSTYQRAVEIAQETPSFGRRLLSTKLGIKPAEVDPIIARLVDDKIVARGQNKTGGVVYSPIAQPPPAQSAESQAPEQPQVPDTSGQAAPAPPPANSATLQQTLDTDALLGDKQQASIQVGDHIFTVEKQAVQTKAGPSHDYVVKNADGDVVAGLRKPAVDAWLAENLTPQVSPATSEAHKLTEIANNAPSGVPEIAPRANNAPQTETSVAPPPAKGSEQIPSVEASPLESHPPTFEEFAAHPEPRRYASTQVNLPDKFAARVRDAAAGIPDSELAEDGREVVPHVTVKWGLHDNDPVAVQRALVGEGPITAKVGKVSIFPSSETGKDYDVVKMDVDSPDLQRLNQRVAALPHTDTHPQYRPHITLAYVKAGEGQKYIGKSVPGLTGQTVTFGNVTHSGQNQVKTEIPLAGPTQAEAPAPTQANGVQQPAASTERERIGVIPQSVILEEEHGTEKARDIIEELRNAHPGGIKGPGPTSKSSGPGRRGRTSGGTEASLPRGISDVQRSSGALSGNAGQRRAYGNSGMETPGEPNAWRPSLSRDDWKRIELYRRVKAALKADDGKTMRAEMVLRANGEDPAAVDTIDTDFLTPKQKAAADRKPALEASVNAFPELARYRNKKTAGALKVASLNPSDKEYGQALRLSFVGERNVRTAETNQLRDRLKKLIPNPVDQEALSLYRDFKNRPGELEQFRLGTHPDLGKLSTEERSAAERMLKKLNPVMDRALHPTAAMLEADKEMTGNFEKKLTEGKKLGFLDSKITNEEYVSHLLQPRDKGEPGEEPQRVPGMKRETSAKIGRYFQFGNERYYPTLLHAVAAGLRPRTLNALDAMTIHGDKHATAAATRLLINYLKETDLGKWGFRGSENIPSDWVELAPQTHAFRNQVHFMDEEGNPSGAVQMLFVPPEVEQALKPITDQNYMNRVFGFMAARHYQGYLKAVELGLSFFHIKALNVTAVNNMGLTAVIDALRHSMDSPYFLEQERNFIRAGGTTSILGQTQEAYRGLQPTAVPTRADVIRGLPGIKQADAVARAITHYTFAVVQRKFKVIDFSLKDAAWFAKNAHATDEERASARAAIAKEVDAAYGGLNWERIGVNKPTLEVARAMMLAPDWTFSNVLNARYSFEGGPAGRAARLFWARSLITGLALSAGLSLLLGHRISRNPTDVYLGDDDQGREIHQNLFFAGAPSDAINLVNNVVDYGAVFGLGHSIAGKLAPMPRAAEQLAENRNWLGQAIIPKGDIEQIAGRDVPDWIPQPIVKSLYGAGWALSQAAPIPFSVTNAVSMMLDPDHEFSAKEYLTTLLGGTRPRHVVPSQ